ncbi:hypothetical protein EVAR_103946_1 [Eumeta japonica]|uniref:Uncharacterized protein n=1 Tax=Eumeta variegata TaxID=151549 RepID=A0A4C1YH50_EUMVA|nr:hypothetical protein EVAR_103946_1 [Eumeta japonica]
MLIQNIRRLYLHLLRGWIIDDDKYDFIRFSGEQLPSSVADIIIQSGLPSNQRNRYHLSDWPSVARESKG